MSGFPYERFQAEQMAFFGRYAKIREKHIDIFRCFDDQDALAEAYRNQCQAQDRMRSWARSGTHGRPPVRSKPEMGAAGALLADYAADIKSCLQGAKLYTCLPSYGLPALDRLDPTDGVSVAHMDRAVDAVFAATGPDVLHYAMRAASDGTLFVSPDGVALGSDPVRRFDENGNGHLLRMVHVYELDPGDFAPEVALVQDPAGNIVPGPFNHEWLCGHAVVPDAVYGLDAVPREYFANVDVSAGGKDLSGLSARAAGTAVSLDAARGFLQGHLDGMRRRYPSVSSAVLDPGTDNGRVKTMSLGGYRVFAGTKSLEAGASFGFARDEDLAWAAKCLFHEREHVRQKEDIFKRKSGLMGRDLDMACMEICAMAYKGYDDATYQYRLSEIDADMNGTKAAVSALSGAFPGVDWEGAMLRAYNQRDQGYDDIKSAVLGSGRLFSQTAAERSRAWQPGHRYESLDGIYARFEELGRKYLTAEHEEPCREFCEHDDAIVEANAWDDKFFGLLNGDGTKSGTERDREIVASVLQGRVFSVESYFPAMAPELAGIRKEYGVDTPALYKMRRAAAVPDMDANGPDGPEHCM